MKQTDKAIQIVEEYIHQHHRDNTDFHLINILIELYMSCGEFDKAVPILDYFSPSEDIPIDITVNIGICELYSGKTAAAEIQFEKLYREVSIKNFLFLVF